MLQRLCRTMSEYEQRDRARFDGIAGTTGALDLAAPSRRARRHRLEQSLRVVPRADFGLVIDAGCGPGFAALYLSGRYRRYIGIDYSPQMVAFARKHVTLENVEFVESHLREYLPPEPADLVFMIGVLHHLGAMQEILNHVASWLKPGGWFVANEPQSANPLVRALRGKRPLVDEHDRVREGRLTAPILHEVYESAGLEDVRIVPQGLISTPFAEAPLGPAWLTTPLSRVACVVDSAAETFLSPVLGNVTWNLIAAGRKPA